MLLNTDEYEEVELSLEGALKKGGRAIREMKGESRRRIVGQGAGGDRTTYPDRYMEGLLLDVFRGMGDVRVISEEAGVIDFGDPAITAVIDPLDGSRNARRGIPLYTFSVAILPVNGTIGEVEFGFVGDLVSGTAYTAIRGKGAFREGDRLQCTRAEKIEILGLEASPMPGKTLRRLMPLIDESLSIRDLGSIALDLCLVASGAMDAVLDMRGLMRWLDILAGKLIVEEAGGRVLCPDGSVTEDTVYTLATRGDIIAASSPELASRIISILSGGVAQNSDDSMT